MKNTSILMAVFITFGGLWFLFNSFTQSQLQQAKIDSLSTKMNRFYQQKNGFAKIHPQAKSDILSFLNQHQITHQISLSKNEIQLLLQTSDPSLIINWISDCQTSHQIKLSFFQIDFQNNEYQIEIRLSQYII